jgi:hypothetical protein
MWRPCCCNIYRGAGPCPCSSASSIFRRKTVVPRLIRNLHGMPDGVSFARLPESLSASVVVTSCQSSSIVCSGSRRRHRRPCEVACRPGSCRAEALRPVGCPDPGACGRQTLRFAGELAIRLGCCLGSEAPLGRRPRRWHALYQRHHPLTLAQSREVIEATRSGSAMSAFHASQQAVPRRHFE